MQLRKFEIDSDFEAMKEWVTDERTHAMWCANLIKHPLSKDNLADTLKEIADRFGDVPYVAISDDGKVGGFFCYSFNNETKEGMLKFVVVDPESRGKGIAGEMLGLRLCVLHNLYFYNHMMEEIREAIEDNRFAEYKKSKSEHLDDSVVLINFHIFGTVSMKPCEREHFI